jgi:hypothetical protein
MFYIIIEVPAKFAFKVADEQETYGTCTYKSHIGFVYLKTADGAADYLFVPIPIIHKTFRLRSIMHTPSLLPGPASR